jgi:hypothetical protein
MKKLGMRNKKEVFWNYKMGNQPYDAADPFGCGETMSDEIMSENFFNFNSACTFRIITNILLH